MELLCFNFEKTAILLKNLFFSIFVLWLSFFKLTVLKLFFLILNSYCTQLSNWLKNWLLNWKTKQLQKDLKMQTFIYPAIQFTNMTANLQSSQFRLPMTASNCTGFYNDNWGLWRLLWGWNKLIGTSFDSNTAHRLSLRL